MNIRRAIIKEMREKRKTYSEIAKSLNISRQRVHQIYKDYITTLPSIVKKVKERDEYQCAICDSNKKLAVHHINGVKTDNNFDNLVTLCRECHYRIEASDRRDFKNSKVEIINQQNTNGTY